MPEPRVLTDAELDAYPDQSCEERPDARDLLTTALHHRARAEKAEQAARRMARAVLAQCQWADGAKYRHVAEAWALLGIEDYTKSTVSERLAALREPEPEKGEGGT